jgi:hypothetical protein
MGRRYSVGFDDVSVAAAQDLLLIQAGSANPICLHEITIGQRGLSAWEAKPLRFYRVTGAPTITGGTSLTPRPADGGNTVASTATVKANMTTVFSGGTATLIRPDEWHFLNGFFYLPAPEDRFELSVSSYFILQLPTAPSASTNVSLSAVWEEFG